MIAYIGIETQSWRRALIGAPPAGPSSREVEKPMKYRLCVLLALLPACGGSRRRPIEAPDVMVVPGGVPDAGSVDAAVSGTDARAAADAPAADAGAMDTPLAPDARRPADAGPVSPAPAPSSDYEARLAFFRTDLFHRIDLTIDPAQWEAYLAEHRRFDEDADKTWFQGTFRIDGVELRNVGFHSFGWGSRDENLNKPNLSLDLDRNVPGQSLRGIERMRLKNNGQDVSGLRQALLYQAMRESSLLAPRSTYAELYVNDVPYGFYFVEESFTQGFVRQRTGNANGATYEPTGCQGFVAPREGGCEALAYYYESNFNPSAGGVEHLVGLCRVLNGPAEDMIDGVAPYIVLSEWVHQVAIDTALAGNNDGFSTAGANYRLYHDTTLDKLRLIVLGPDDTFVPGELPEPDFLEPEPYEDCLDENPDFRDIFLEKLVATQRGLDIYRGTVHKLRTGVLAAGTFKARIDTLWSVVGPHAKADPRRNPDYDAEESKDLIKEFVDRRWPTLEQAGF